MARLCTLERLPFDYAAAADEIANALSHHQERAANQIDLSGTSALARRLGDELRALPLEAREPAAGNVLLMDLGRLLIPVNYTRSGPFGQDLALGTGPLPGLTDAARLAAVAPAGDEARFLRTGLLRERNRVEHALRASLRRVAHFAAAASGES